MCVHIIYTHIRHLCIHISIYICVVQCLDYYMHIRVYVHICTSVHTRCTSIHTHIQLKVWIFTLSSLGQVIHPPLSLNLWPLK